MHLQRKDVSHAAAFESTVTFAHVYRLQALTCWRMLQACLESVGVDGVLLREWTQRDAGFLLPL